MLKLDLYHSHPILKAFVDVCWEILQEKRDMESVTKNGVHNAKESEGVQYNVFCFLVSFKCQNSLKLGEAYIPNKTYISTIDNCRYNQT